MSVSNGVLLGLAATRACVGAPTFAQDDEIVDTASLSRA